MSVSVSWNTGLISVPKADMPVVQVSPEIRELDVDALRLELRTLEAGGDTYKLGVPRQKTHNHVTETVVSGDTFARFVIFLSPYTIEFEAGLYTVKCVGANHNIADVMVQNGVGIIIGNSFGLIRGPGTDVGAVADAVWDEASGDHTTPGSMGDLQNSGGTGGGGLIPSGS